MNIEIIDDDGLKIFFPQDKDLKYIKEVLNKIKNNEIEIIKTEKLSLQQSKLIWILCKEYGELIGYTKEEMRELLHEEFCNSKEMEYFSISTCKRDSCSKETATEFIQFIIEHSLEQGYNLIIPDGKGVKRVYKSVREVVPSIQRYEIACLRNKTCEVCGSKVDVTIHHHDRISETVTTYDKDDGLHGRMMALCPKCHTIAHNMSKKDFEDRYFIQGVWLTPSLVNELKKIYTNHFKAFKSEDYIREYKGD